MSSPRVENLAEGVSVYLGDCRDVMQSIGHFDSVVTDPPFGMMFQSNHRNIKHMAIENDGSPDALRFAVSLPVLHSKYIFCRWDNLLDVDRPKSLVTWVKNNWSMGELKHEHARQTEVVLFYPGPNHLFPKKRPTDVIECARTGNNFHPTEKPVDLMCAVVEWTQGTVLDAFMGSRSTGVACAKLQRGFIGIEIEQSYFDIACRRISEALRQPNFLVDRIPPARQESLAL